MTMFEKYDKTYPMQEMIIDGLSFKYRYYKNPKSDVTLVLLTGGIGLSDLLCVHFELFAEHFSVITFDYHSQYKTVDQLCNTISRLLSELNIKVWFVGQSLGGFIAQVMAQKYPWVTEGLVLSNTGTLSKDLNTKGYDSLLTMMQSTKKSIRLLRFIPFSLFKKLLRKKIISKYGSTFNDHDKKVLIELCDIMDGMLTKNYELHMMNLLIDLKNHFGLTKENMAFLHKKCLLILSDDDKTFNNDVKLALIDIMPSPTLVSNLVGGHLSLLVNPSEYVSIITEYIQKN